MILSPKSSYEGVLMQYAVLFLALFWGCLALFDILFGIGIFGEEPYCGILCGMDLMEPPKEAANVPKQ